MQLKQKAMQVLRDLMSLPKRYTIPGAIIIVGGILYVVAFGISKPVSFSYGGQTCVARLTLLPDVQRPSGSDGFHVVMSDIASIGGWNAFARQVCIKPVSPPLPGVAKVSVSPFGGIIAKQTFRIAVPSPVKANAAVFDAPIAVSKPLVLPLSGDDVVFSYELAVGDKEVACSTRVAALSCDVPKLKLMESSHYAATLTRHFNGEKIATVATGDIVTLAATTVIESSIPSGGIIYDKPALITTTFDKSLKSAKATLYRVNEKGRTVVSAVPTTDAAKLTLTLSDQLQRSASYQLEIERVEATDGSGLSKPYVQPFTVSGGPKVTGVSIGGSGVVVGSTVVVSFDQPLHETQNISSMVKLDGGLQFVGKRDNQLLFSTTAIGKCQDFSIALTGDIQSRHEVAGGSAWKFTSRTVCHTLGTIGYSTKGRPINAYYFGEGPRAVVFTGAIHGNEVSTRYLMDRWVQDLEAQARRIPAGTSIAVVPVINPDGMASGSRVNGNNVDLNRNFDTSDWKKDITTVTNQPFPGGGGEKPMSEPETQAIASLVRQLRPKVVLSYHSIGGVLVANQAGNSGALTARYGELSGYGNATGSSTTFDYGISGTADDWYGQQLGVPSIVVELGSHTYHQFERNQAAMWEMVTR